MRTPWLKLPPAFAPAGVMMRFSAAPAGPPATTKITSKPVTNLFMAVSAVEGAVDDVQLLFAGEAHEVHRVAGDADGQARVLLRMVHGVDQRVAIEHVHVHVVPGAGEKRVEDRGEVVGSILLGAAEAGRH